MHIMQAPVIESTWPACHSYPADTDCGMPTRLHLGIELNYC